MAFDSGNFTNARELILWREEDSRHSVCGEPAGGLFGGRASEARGCDEEREPEPTAAVAGCGSRRDEPGGGMTDIAAGLGQEPRPLRSAGQLVQRPCGSVTYHLMQAVRRTDRLSAFKDNGRGP